MQEFKDWKEFINRILIDSGQFENATSDLRNTTEIETFKSTKKGSLTEIRVGYFTKENKLIYLHIFNPTVPGYNKYVFGEYFYQYHFSEPPNYGDPALEFNELNRNGIISILEKGLKGKEVQFIKNKKILKSKLYISESNPNFSYSYDFTKRGFWKKIFGQKIDKMDGIEKKEIELNTIFNGIKTCYNTI
ncbi:hypothetical protein NO995_08385 [Aestuariibaculum sp. M13]|uniref:hypothetical protein n=1 Tax=Aestuariibaculum sp. M13 TaxID=2967132 RepID=UPI002159FE05|nr:hypothetical protein [Aestuariibaculum sp. M13]MCR8667697.1 hypothetical protein [Aestuariibaculum sp. M13]